MKVKMKNKKTVEMKVLVANIKCLCGGQVCIGEIEGDSCVTHTIPYCKDFEINDPTDFLHFLNKSYLS